MKIWSWVICYPILLNMPILLVTRYSKKKICFFYKSSFTNNDNFCGGFSHYNILFLNPCSTIITTMFSDNNHSTKLHSDNPLSLDTYLSFTLLLETPCFLHKKTLKYGLCSTQTWRNINVNSNALYNYILCQHRA